MFTRLLILNSNTFDDQNVWGFFLLDTFEKSVRCFKIDWFIRAGKCMTVAKETDKDGVRDRARYR